MTATNLKHEFAYADLRDWIDEADRLGEIKRLTGINWQREIGMVGAMLQRADPSPCAIFDDIPGIKPGFRVLVNFFGGKRANVTLGFPAGLSKTELSDAFLKVYKNPANKPIKHVIVDDGPVFENIITGDAVDITTFPAPQWHAEDGGRYIGTGCYSVTRDPDDGWLNQGTYRVMVHDEKSVGIYISPGKHGRMHRDKYAARGEKMPMAIVLGGNPMQFLLTGNEVPFGVSEYDVLGGLYKAPLECVRGKVTGLPFPKNAEIVLEGWIDPNELREEGPLGEWTGYYASGARPEPVMRVEAIYHRDDPIILGSVHELGPSEYARYRAITRSALLKEALQAAGLPDITGVWAHEVGGARMFVGRRHQAALCRPRTAGRACRLPMPGRRLCGQIRRGGRRRHRRVGSRRADVGDADTLRPGDLDRHRQQCLVDAARPAHSAGEARAWRLHQQPRHHRCLPAVPLARQVSQSEHAAARGHQRDPGPLRLGARGLAQGAVRTPGFDGICVRRGQERARKGCQTAPVALSSRTAWGMV